MAILLNQFLAVENRNENNTKNKDLLIPTDQVDCEKLDYQKKYPGE
jgi:hypothetical protein